MTIILIGMSSTFASTESVDIRSIKDQLPTRCSEELGTLSSCWNQYKLPLKVFKIDSNNINSLFSFFKNKNYQVKKKSNFLIFDFKKEHQNYLNHKRELFSIELLVIGFICLIGFLSIPVLAFNHKKHVQKVKRYYNKNSTDLFFFDFNNKKELEESLLNNKIPCHWYFIFDRDKIVKIKKSQIEVSIDVAVRSEDYFKNKE